VFETGINAASFMPIF